VLEDERGRSMSMADMHDHSERRYFIAHRSFSDLMETWIGEGLVTYDPESGRWWSRTPAARSSKERRRKSGVDQNRR
jgi:hypothetical protein